MSTNMDLWREQQRTTSWSSCTCCILWQLWHYHHWYVSNLQYFHLYCWYHLKNSTHHSIHLMVWCGVGIRYKCVNCEDYDLCSTCETKNVHNPTHLFLKIKRPIPYHINQQRRVLLPNMYEQTTASCEQWKCWKQWSGRCPWRNKFCCYKQNGITAFHFSFSVLLSSTFFDHTLCFIVLLLQFHSFWVWNFHFYFAIFLRSLSLFSLATLFFLEKNVWSMAKMLQWVTTMEFVFSIEYTVLYTKLNSVF